MHLFKILLSVSKKTSGLAALIRRTWDWGVGQDTYNEVKQEKNRYEFNIFIFIISVLTSSEQHL